MQLEEACRIVEAACREIGQKCEVIFARDGTTQVAPMHWQGAGTGATFFEAVEHAQRMARVLGDFTGSGRGHMGAGNPRRG